MVMVFKKLISYFFPLTRNIRSKYSGNLELTLVNGRMVLDTANANYSYGTLQRVLRFALDKIDLSSTSNILLLGLGGGSVIKTLRDVFAYQGKIVAVDIDPVIIKVAEEEFGIKTDYRTIVVCSDATDFVDKSAEKYDVIIIDLFIDNKVPVEFLSIAFFNNVKDILICKGHIIFNTINPKNNSLELIRKALKEWGFKLEEYQKVEKINTLLVASSL